MKLPNSPIVQAVAKHYGIKTKGKLLQWLNMMSPMARLYYNLDGEDRFIRVKPLMKNEMGIL